VVEGVVNTRNNIPPGDPTKLMIYKTKEYLRGDTNLT